MSKAGLSEHGKAVVAQALVEAENFLKRAEIDLSRAQKNLIFMRQVSECDHDLYVAGGYTLIETKCKKCGFAWYD
jgi:hypothetical protein